VRLRDFILVVATPLNSLNQLSKAVGAGTENAWQNWYVKGKDRTRDLIMSRRTK